MEQQENRSYPSFSTSTPPIALSLLVFVVTTIKVITDIVVYTILSFDWLLNFIEEHGLSQISLFNFLNQLFLITPHFIVMIFVYLLLYKFTGDILRKEKKLNNVAYSISRVLLSLWIFGIVGAFGARIIVFIFAFDPASPRISIPIIYLLFSLLTEAYYILLDPLVPILVVFFRMAYEKTISSQLVMKKAKSGSSFASESSISILLILLTFISCMLLSVGSFLYYLLNSLLIPVSNEVYFRLIVDRLFSIGFSILSLFLYLGLGILTMSILKEESEKNLRYMMRDSLFKLYLGGLLGALSYFLGINILMGIILSSYTNFVELFYSILMGGLISLRAPLIPVLIVLVLIAHEGLFSSQNNYEM
ncbi:MAG: hypothetical protein ACFFCZ_14860 [Promethearchaeota archaeon]